MFEKIFGSALSCFGHGFNENFEKTCMMDSV